MKKIGVYNKVEMRKLLESQYKGEEKMTDQEQYEKVYKEKTKARDRYNAVRRHLRDESRLEDFQEKFEDTAHNLKRLPLIKYKKLKKGVTNNEAIMLFSDWHIGQYNNNFYHTYNFEIAKEYLKSIIADIIHHCRIHRVKKLHVLNLGDLIEGIINTNARCEQEFDAATQTMKASELMAECVNILQKAAPVVTYRSVVDNHARYHKDKNQNIAKENMNRISDWFIKERLKDTGVIFPEDNLDISLGKFTLDCGKVVMFAHGHESKKDRCLQEMVGATKGWVDIVCLAHYHNPAEHVYQNMRLFINGSLSGTGQYALSIKAFTEPSQKLLIVNEKDFMNIDIGVKSTNIIKERKIEKK